MFSHSTHVPRCSLGGNDRIHALMLYGMEGEERKYCSTFRLSHFWLVKTTPFVARFSPCQGKGTCFIINKWRRSPPSLKTWLFMETVEGWREVVGGCRRESSGGILSTVCRDRCTSSGRGNVSAIPMSRLCFQFKQRCFLPRAQRDNWWAALKSMMSFVMSLCKVLRHNSGIKKVNSKARTTCEKEKETGTDCSVWCTNVLDSCCSLQDQRNSECLLNPIWILCVLALALRNKRLERLRLRDCSEAKIKPLALKRR